MATKRKSESNSKSIGSRLLILLKVSQEQAAAVVGGGASDWSQRGCF